MGAIGLECRCVWSRPVSRRAVAALPRWARLSVEVLMRELGERRGSVRQALLIPLCAAGLFAALAGYLRVTQAIAVRESVAEGLAARPVTEVARAVRAMDLLTVRLDTTVLASSGNDTWRGAVMATVRAPVSFFYGTDLGAARIEAMDLGPMLGGYRVIAPMPRRVAIEVRGERERAEVQTGWLRLRSRGGEYHLGLARKGLAEEARRMRLSEEDQALVVEQTRRRLIELVRAIAGERARVSVEFVEAPEPVEEVLTGADETANEGLSP